MKGPPLGPRGEDITWLDQVAPRGRKASSTRKLKPQTSNLLALGGMECSDCVLGDHEEAVQLLRFQGGGSSVVVPSPFLGWVLCSFVPAISGWVILLCL